MVSKDPYVLMKRLMGVDEVTIRVNLRDGTIFDAVPAFLGEKECDAYRKLFASGADEVYLNEMISPDYGSFVKTSERSYPTQDGVLVIEFNYRNETGPQWKGELKR